MGLDSDQRNSRPEQVHGRPVAEVQATRGTRTRLSLHDYAGLDGKPVDDAQDLGQCVVADQDACLDVPIECIRGEVGGGDDGLFVVLDDGPWAIALVDGKWNLPTLRVSASSWYVNRKDLLFELGRPGDTTCQFRGRE